MTVAITVAICTYNRYDYLDKAIASAKAQDLVADRYNILVLDNSPDGPARQASVAKYAADARVEYLTLDTPGLSNARNVACAESTAPYIIFLDDDAVAKPDWLRLILETFEQYSDAGVVGGRILPDFEVPPPVWLNSAHAVSYLSVIDWPMLEGQKARLLQANEWIAGASIAFDRAALVAAGGFSTSLGRKGSGSGNLLSNEETEAIKAMQVSGKKIYYSGAAEVSHFVPADRMKPEWLRRRAAWQAVSDQMAENMPAHETEQAWETVLDYFKPFPQELAGAALCVDTDNAALFEKQLRAMRAFVRLTLATGKLPIEVKV